ncbi:thioredoxin reductase [Thermodesulfobium narugense DSM 14796]|uniref:Thioredoxin reductase n=1 Tax=Thermodesulfobium narugense DSM 14796 TaxID=747365 RepID=M1E4T8_9BACT|nr:thioredoxin-disulfide reductase [Thermodesulfobium narugense]AEE14527.1 thioredoxin reductase [Thermodesulfobium narugense DSM 14796]
MSIIDEKIKSSLKENFLILKDKVNIKVVLPEEKDQFYEYTKEIFEVLPEVSDKISVQFISKSDVLSKLIDEEIKCPIVIFDDEKLDAIFVGTPIGEEAHTLVNAILLISGAKQFLNDKDLSIISDVKKETVVEVYVSPTCPYCPQQAIMAINASMINRNIKTKIIEIFENKEIAQKKSIRSVPVTYVDNEQVAVGLQSNEEFVLSLIGKEVQKLLHNEKDKLKEFDLTIVGAGPAGLSAAIYARRSGLSVGIFEAEMVGGQVLTTPQVENYPGFISISGKSLVDILTQHVLNYVSISIGEEVKKINRVEDYFKVITSDDSYRSKAVLLATGASKRKLKVPGEASFYGKGVSYCALCDGYFYKGKEVFIVGGGNTALTDAIYLKNVGADVTLIHRRDALRAEKYLQDSFFKLGIEVMWNSEVKEILGKESVEFIKIVNNLTGEEQTQALDGLFIAIGYLPNNSLAKDLGVELDEEGYIKVDKNMRTNVHRVYAAGDIVGGEKQIVVAVSRGAIAATSAFEDILSPYWVKK